MFSLANSFPHKKSRLNINFEDAQTISSEDKKKKKTKISSKKRNKKQNLDIPNEFKGK